MTTRHEQSDTSPHEAGRITVPAMEKLGRAAVVTSPPASTRKPRWVEMPKPMLGRWTLLGEEPGMNRLSETHCP